MKGGSISRRIATLDRDVAGGVLILVVGLAFAYFGRSYDVGTLSQMGPGFMPVVLGCLLAFLGLLILINGLVTASISRREDDVSRPPDWRGLVGVVAGMVAFMFLSASAGMIVSSLAVVLLAALGDRTNRVREAVLLAVGVTVFGVLVFYFGMQIRLPLLPPGFGP